MLQTVLCCTSCNRPIQQTLIEHHRHDSLVVRTIHDTLQQYTRDSVYVFVKGDTLIREVWHNTHNNTVQHHTDTVYVSRQDAAMQTVVKKKKPTLTNIVLLSMAVVCALVLVVLCFRTSKNYQS